MTSRTTELRRFQFRAEAELARSVLEGAGIPAEIVADDLGGQVPGMLPARLYVREEDRDEGRRVLEDAGLAGGGSQAPGGSAS